jgi:hypothetical protein
VPRDEPPASLGKAPYALIPVRTALHLIVSVWLTRSRIVDIFLMFLDDWLQIETLAPVNEREFAGQNPNRNLFRQRRAPLIEMNGGVGTGVGGDVGIGSILMMTAVGSK